MNKIRKSTFISHPQDIKLPLTFHYFTQFLLNSEIENILAILYDCITIKMHFYYAPKN